MITLSALRSVLFGGMTKVRAHAAHARCLSVFLGVAVGVCFVPLVPMRAMSLSPLQRSGYGAPDIAGYISAANVHLPCDRLKVFWIDAAMNPAQMVKVQSLWNWPDERLVGESMSQPRARLAIFADDREPCVFSLIHFRGPEPASAVRLRADERQYPISDWYSRSTHCDSFLIAMVRAARRVNAVAARSNYTRGGVA